MQEEKGTYSKETYGSYDLTLYGGGHKKKVSAHWWWCFHKKYSMLGLYIHFNPVRFGYPRILYLTTLKLLLLGKPKI